MDLKKIFIALIAAAALLLTAVSVSAQSGFPARDYPSNMYGHQATYYNGPWGERMILGSHGYFPNSNGYYPYGYRSYGNMYTPWDMRYGATSCGSCGSSYRGYGGYASRPY